MNILHAYFNSQLVKAGFPDNMKIEYSLSYCQGDGTAFYGRLYQDDLKRLFNRLYSSKRKQKMFAKLIGHILEWSETDSIRISKNWFGYRYYHWKCMDLDATEAEYQPFFSSGKKDWYFPKTKLGKYMALWDEFITDLREYIRDLSRRLEQEGYRIIEATPYESQVAYKFETANYRVELVTEPHHFYDHNFETYMYDCDFDDVESLCSQVLKGQARFANVYAQVVDKQTGVALGEDYFGYLTYDPADKTLGGYRYILIREAIKAARANDGLISRQAQLMHKHLTPLQSLSQN